MNPRNRSRKQLGLSLVIVLATGVMGFTLTRQAHSASTGKEALKSAIVTISTTGRKLVGIETAPVLREGFSETLHLTGQVVYPLENTVKISPRLAGRVQAVSVRVGDPVRAGQTLALLDSVDAVAAQNTARQNANKLRLAQETFNRTERLYRLGTSEVSTALANLDQAKARTAFTKETLARIRQQAGIGGFTQKPVEDAKNALVTAKSTLAQAQSDAALAARDHNRKVKLIEIGIASRSDLEASENVLDKAKTQVEAAGETVALAQAALNREQKAFQSNLYADGQVRSAESDHRQAQLQQEAAERSVKLAQIAIRRDLQQAKSDLLAAQSETENSRRTLEMLGRPGKEGQVKIIAPLSGIVTERNVSAGQVVDQSQMTPWQMFTIVNVSSVFVEADIYEKDIALVAPGAPVTVTVTAFPGQKFVGTVYRISPALDSKTRAIKLRARIENPTGSLKDGMYAEVTVGEAKKREALSIPLTAVQHEGDSDFVYVEEMAGKYVRRTVTIGDTRGEKVIVLGGLKPHEKVVSRGGLFVSEQGKE